MKPTGEQWDKAKLQIIDSGTSCYFSQGVICPLCAEVVKMTNIGEHVCDDRVLRALAFLNALPNEEISAFRGLFRGAKLRWTIFLDDSPRAGRPFTMNKAECEWIEDWRGFYLEKLPAAGLLETTETEPAKAPSGVLVYHVEIKPTELAFKAMEAWRRLP